MNRIFVAAFVAMFALPTFAASGTVNVNLGFWAVNGGYCDSTESSRNCTGAVWTEADVNKRRSLKNMKVYIVRSSDLSVLGQGTINSAGTGSISWASWPWEAAPMARVLIRFEQVDGRFVVEKPDGTGHHAFAGSFQLQDNGNQSRTETWGTGANPNLYTNLYDAAWMAWDSLSDSARMVNVFTNWRIRAFNTNNDNSTTNNITQLSTLAQFDVLTVAHEAGHYSWPLANSMRPLADYGYNNEFGHEWDSVEYQADAFSEGQAEFQSIRSVYRQNSPQPITCRNARARCPYDFSLFVERSLGSSCSVYDARRESNVARYLWDVYDNVVDGYGDNLSKGYFVLFDAMTDWTNGPDNRQDDEPFTSTGGIDNRDGRNMADFANVYSSQYDQPFSSSAQLSNNCGSILNP
jgi:hypothetical protein